TQDVLNNSIVVRNLQELGVDSIEALKFLFPSKTDEERAAMLSGFPFRMVGELQNAFSQFARLVGGMMQTPHPESPDLPMAADPRLDLTPYLYRTLEALQKEMSYAGRYRPIDPTDEPSVVSSTQQLRDGGSSSDAIGGGTGTSSGSGGLSGGYQLPPSGPSSEYQLPIRPYSVRPPIPTDLLGANAAGSTGEQSVGIGVQQGGGAAELTSPIPIPGSTVDDDGSSLYPGQLWNAQQPGYATIGDADLVSQPGLIAQLFPNLVASLLGNGRPGGGGLLQPEQRKPSGVRRVRGRSTSNSK
ncbi:MAG: hypothetical protein EBS53_07855, partial [Bacteroidetes bacterium]|nr:hypothetical protein [Bacteroidota bacterium]